MKIIWLHPLYILRYIKKDIQIKQTKNEEA